MNRAGLMTDPMTDSAGAQPVPPGGVGGGAEVAGQLLRVAREAKGLDLGALSAAVKVPLTRLQALEAGRIHELPDLTFARALAKTICRFVGTDPEPVLAHFPVANLGPPLVTTRCGLNEPFRPMGLSRHFGFDWGGISRPAMLAPVLLVLGAIVVYFWPSAPLVPEFSEQAQGQGGQTNVAGDVSGSEAGVPAPVSKEGPVVASVSPTSAAELGVLNAPLLPPGSAASSAGTAAEKTLPGAVPLVQGPLVLRASAESWVEVRDADGRVLLAKLLMPGETTGVDGVLPLRLKVGNVEATQVVFKGQVQDLSAWRKANVARLVLQ